MFRFDYSKLLEHNIREYLTDLKLRVPETPRVLMFKLYTDLSNSLASLRYPISKFTPAPPLYKTFSIPAALFTKTIGDMKKIGIVGTAKDSQQVFLSDSAWDEYRSSPNSNGEILRVLLTRLYAFDVFPSVDAAIELMIEADVLTKQGEGNYCGTLGTLPVWDWVYKQADAARCGSLIENYYRAAGIRFSESKTAAQGGR